MKNMPFTWRLRRQRFVVHEPNWKE
jgi:hypothetical protein